VGQEKKAQWLKYGSCGDARLIARNQELYPLVYQKTSISNNSIFVSFACGLLVERIKFKVNWARFAEQVQTMGVRSIGLGHDQKVGLINDLSLNILVY
jgi:hypothetical protein